MELVCPGTCLPLRRSGCERRISGVWDPVLWYVFYFIIIIIIILIILICQVARIFFFTTFCFSYSGIPYYLFAEPVALWSKKLTELPLVSYRSPIYCYFEPFLVTSLLDRKVDMITVIQSLLLRPYMGPNERYILRLTGKFAIAVWLT